MARDNRPTMHVIAGPNGAGKSTLYADKLAKKYPGVEFVNADLLAHKHFGHPAVTEQESKVGQQLAEARRSQLMAERKSFIFESTFSHPSKLDELHQAKADGYRIAVYHVNVRSPEISVYRVASRVQKGGHDVPEQKTRERFVRNQPLIREAVLMADAGQVFDNSKVATPHTLAIAFDRGTVSRVNGSVPVWARELYGKELDRLTPEQVNMPAVSFADASSKAQQAIGADTRTFIARNDGRYSGPIVAESSMHVVQQIGARSAVAHFKSRLDLVPALGQQVSIIYDLQKNMRGHTQALDAPARPPLDDARRERIDNAVRQIELAAKHIALDQAGTLQPAILTVQREGSQRVRAVMENHPDALERFERGLKRHESTLGPLVARTTLQRKNDPDISR